MKILQIHNFYKSPENGGQIGGEDVVVRQEFLALQQALGRDNVFSYYQSNDDFTPKKLLSSFFAKQQAKYIYNFIQDNKINIVHIHNFFPLINPNIILAAKKAGAKVIMTLHNYRLWCLNGLLFLNDQACFKCVNQKFMIAGVKNQCYKNHTLSFIMASMFAYYKYKRIFEHIDCFFALTEFQKKLLIKLNISTTKIIVKPNAVDFKKDLLFNDNPKDFIYVGRIEAAKGFDRLYKAWQNITSSLKLNIIGKGEAKKLPNINYLGVLNNDLTKQKIANAKFLIQPAIAFETFGLTIIEAMSLGVPVIGYNIGTRSELIKHGETGFLADFQPDNLAKIIEMAANLSDLEYQKLSKNCKLFASQFKLETIITNQINIYEDLYNNS